MVDPSPYGGYSALFWEWTYSWGLSVVWLARACDQVAVVGDVVGEQRSQTLDIVAPVAMQFAGHGEPRHRVRAGGGHKDGSVAQASSLQRNSAPRGQARCLRYNLALQDKVAISSGAATKAEE